MSCFKITLFAAILAVGKAASSHTTSRGLLENIAGYTPTTVVTDQNAIDQDQRTMETSMSNATDAAFLVGLKVYENGGNSGSYASLKLGATPSPLPKAGDTVAGVDASANAIVGKVYENYVAGSPLKVVYPVSDVQLAHVTCRVGGLVSTITIGCFAASGNIKINGGADVAYTYVVATDNMNYRTLQSLSTTAAQQQKAPVGNYPYFQKYLDYFGVPDYVDQIVQSAFKGTSVTLNGKLFDFVGHPLRARDQMVKKSTAYTTLVMVVLGQMERAVEYCVAKDDTLAINALDQAVAFYSGSLEGNDGSGSGYTLHNHADRRCGGFRACGTNADAINGTAKVNVDMFATFNAMKTSLLAKDCAAAKTASTKGMPTLLIPQIQGTLRYMRVLATRVNYTGHETAEAEGAAFSTGILPMVAGCNAAAGSIIFNAMKIKAATPPNVVNVQAAFHSVYKCLGIKCADVGGQYNTTTSAYIPGYEPCVDVVTPTSAPVAAPVTAPATAPVTAPATAPVKAPAVAPAAPAAAPAAAPTTTGRKRCGLFNLSLFCPLSGCGLFGRLLRLCPV